MQDTQTNYSHLFSQFDKISILSKRVKQKYEINRFSKIEYEKLGDRSTKQGTVKKNP